nr:DNA-directed RNA polymerase III subunit RPC9 isoform X1 [Dromaius novaehollandiae]
MEVKDANAALLSNFEVYQLLTDLKQQRKESGKNKQSSGQQNLNTIMYETLKYISKTPCRYQSPETVRDFLITMKGHKLTKSSCSGKEAFAALVASQKEMQVESIWRAQCYKGSVQPAQKHEAEFDQDLGVNTDTLTESRESSAIVCEIP